MKRKSILVLTIILMAIGFASVSTVLYLNGQTFVASNTGDFDVYFSKASENGVENNAIIQDKTHIVFTTELKKINEEYVLDYEVTNASKQYDTNVVMNCTGGNEYLRVTNEFETNEILPARTIRPGKLTLTVLKEVVEEVRVEISCEIVGTAQERTSVGSEEFTTERPLYATESLLEKVNAKNTTIYTEGNIHEMYTFDHAKTEQMPANTDYRYIGNDPYNYIKFNNEIWRIIGVFPDEEGTYRMKLIRNDPFEKVYYDSTHNRTSSWEHSDIRELMRTKVSEKVKEKYVDEVTYYLGTLNTNNKVNVESIYAQERNKEIYKEYYSYLYPRKVNIKDKVSLMYPSDNLYTYALGVDSVCFNNTSNCKGEKSWLTLLDKINEGNSTIYDQWTLSPVSGGSYAAVIMNGGGWNNTGAILQRRTRPVVYLKTNIEFKQGDYDGSKEKPYELVEVKD